MRPFPPSSPSVITANRAQSIHISYPYRLLSTVVVTHVPPPQSTTIAKSQLFDTNCFCVTVIIGHMLKKNISKDSWNSRSTRDIVSYQISYIRYFILNALYY